MALLPTEKVCGINQQTFGAYLVLILEFIFLILFAVFVRYDKEALPATAEGKTYHVTDLYPMQCVLLVLGLAFLEYESKANASDKRHTIHHTGGGFNPHTIRYEFKNDVALFMDTHVMIFIGFGYLMTFLKRYSFGAVGFTFLFGAVLVQWAILSNGFYEMEGNYTIPLNLKSLLSADIAAAAPLISMGALLGRTTYVQLILMGVIELAIFSANNYLADQMWKVSDAGASIFVHTFGAYFGLAVSFVLHRKRPEDNEHDFESSYTSDVFAMIGTVFLWLFWPSFNAAEVAGDSQHRAVINTYMSLAACCVTAFILSYLFSPERKFDMVHVQNSTLAGGVAVGASADLMVQPWGAMLVGVCAAFISVFGYSILSPYLAKRFKIADTCGIHNLHGMPGIVGGIVAAIMASVATTEMYGGSLFDHYPAMAPSSTKEMHEYYSTPGEGRTAAQQAGYQLIALAVTFAVAIVGGLITGVIINWNLFDLGEQVDKHKDDNFWKIEEAEAKVA